MVVVGKGQGAGTQERGEFGLGVMWTPEASLDIGKSKTTRVDFMLHPGLTLFQKVGQLFASRCPLGSRPRDYQNNSL